MDPERWQQIDQLFHAALGRNGSERAAFLAEACVGDESLRQEVEALLSSHHLAVSFMETPAGDVAADLLAELHTQLKSGTMVNRYKILEILGKGGMGEVYLAQDTKLGRKVALKLLSTYLSGDGDRLRRFEQEAHAASALSHANVCVVHEVGEAEGGRHYIVMEYIEGLTLRERMAESRMKISEVLDAAVQVASALTAAHQAGVVHRDIKPDNVIVRPDGYLKVLDFGLAKLTERPAFHADSEAATRAQVRTNPGMVMGTIQYMSPEQARGKEVDARTDIWSFGVMLYEMVTGRVPFEGETPSHVIVSLIESEPPLLTTYPEVPAELGRIVNKALRKNREERYQTTRDLVLDLKNLKQELEAEARLERSLQPDRSGPPSGRLLPGVKTAPPESGTPNTRPFTHPTSSAEYIVGEVKRHKLILALALLTVAAVAAAAVYFTRPGEALDSVAVLPFDNVGGDPNNEYLSEGISDSIINSLSQLPNLKVISLSSVLRYKGKQTEPQAVGRELNVRAVLMGRLMKQGDALTIITELVDVRDNRQLWGQQYTLKLSDMQQVQGDISREISDKLRLRLSGDEKQQLAKRYTYNSQAYQLYILARYYRRQGTKEGWEKGIEYANEAIKIDGSYAPAYVELGADYSELGLRGFLPSTDARQKAESAALKAVELEDTLCSAHAGFGYIKKRNWDWSAAEKEFERALELDRNCEEARVPYGAYLLDVGRANEAVEYQKRVQQLDPLVSENLGLLGFAYLGARQYDRAIEVFQKVIAKNPNRGQPHFFLGEVYVYKGKYEDGIAELQNAVAIDNAPERWDRDPTLAYAYAVAGKRDEALKILDQQKGLAKQRYISPFNFAIIYTGLGDKDRAFEWLGKAYEERSQAMDHIKMRPMFDSLRADPRYADLLRRMNLTP
jgi:serine/threonine protein kinase/Tfp pilus assembly protein PilF